MLTRLLSELCEEKAMCLEALWELFPEIKDDLENREIGLKDFETNYLEEMLVLKTERFDVVSYPSPYPDTSKISKAKAAKDSFNAYFQHVLSVRKRTVDELAGYVLSEMQDVYRTLRLLAPGEPFENQEYCLSELKRGNNPRYKAKGVEIQMNRGFYYSGMSLYKGGKDPGIRKFFAEANKRYGPEMNLLMENIYRKLFAR